MEGGSDTEQRTDAMRANEAAMLAFLDHQTRGGPQQRLGTYQPPSDSDLYGSDPWPDFNRGRGAFRVFQDDLEPCSYDSASGWRSLPKDQKAVYRTRAEALRREAWAQFEISCAARGPARPGSARLTTGFECFRDRLGTAVGFQEVLTRWEP
jgi:hypothetical protein